MRDRKSDQHRVLTQQRLRRKLGYNEVVDHVNEDKTDNTPSNLVVKSRSAHTTGHNKRRSLSRLRASLRMVKEGRKSY